MRPRTLGILATVIAPLLLLAPSASGWSQLAPITPDAAHSMVYTKGLALDAHSNPASIWVTDVGQGAPNDKVYRFPLSASGATVPSQTITGNFTGGGSLNYPGGIAVNQANGDLYVADTNNNRIVQFNANGMLLNYSYGKPGTIALTRPHGLKIVGDTLYIANSGSGTTNRGIKRVSLDLQTWGSDITSTDFHTGPSDIAVDATHNRIWAADEGYRAGETDPGVTSATLGRVLEFNLTTGAQVHDYTRPASGPDPFGQPYSVEYDAAANLLYLADYAKNSIFVLNADDGSLAGKIGAVSPVSPNTPVAMALDPASRILYVGQVGTKTWNGPGAREIERFQLDPVSGPTGPTGPTPPTGPTGSTGGGSTPAPELPVIMHALLPKTKATLTDVRIGTPKLGAFSIRGRLSYYAKSGAPLSAAACKTQGDVTLLRARKHSKRKPRTINSTLVKFRYREGGCSSRFTIDTDERFHDDRLSVALTAPATSSAGAVKGSFALSRKH
ncbi:MAG: NHL repeat-containing protein [Solirubrobacterales bacterium]